LLELPVLTDSTYTIEAEIGSGGGGIVYKAWHTRLQKHVVIKELKRGSQNEIETQRNEVEALKNVKSPYIPQVFDFITEGDRIFTVMEFIEGESLDKVLENNQSIEQSQIMKWYGQLLSALGTIHEKEVYHRDIKPANIMLMPSGDVCLIDFNAALVQGNDIQLISRSLGYASPEQYEIFEKFKSSLNNPIKLTYSSDISPSINVDKTVLLDDERTELLTEKQIGLNSDETEHIKNSNGKSDITLLENSIDSIKKENEGSTVDWKRSDIFSLGATIYHLLTKKRPSQRADETLPISKIGRFSEGIVYVVERSMRLIPAERFSDVKTLSDIVKNIHKHDMRWKIAKSKRVVAAVILPVMFSLFASLMFFGINVMAQEREEHYYSLVYEIENGEAPRNAFDTALTIYWDRIDPYISMARRLWSDGNMEMSKSFIEENLGNLARFQTVPEAQRNYGDIYFILGNCYFYQPGDPDYFVARGNYEIAIQYVQDNYVLFRNLVIALVRTGEIEKAEEVLEKARMLDIEADSLYLLEGEISFAKGNYIQAIESFNLVISQTVDDYIRYRAYHASDTIFKLLGQPERSVALLSNSLSRIPINRVPEMIERLADAYARTGDFENAIILFEELVNIGVPQFHVLNGLVIMLQNIGEIDRAATVLEQMTNLFPGEYRVFMRKAFLEVYKQSLLLNEDRDYIIVKLYYDEAVALYDTTKRPGESDSEMQQLELLIEQLRTNNWLD